MIVINHSNYEGGFNNQRVMWDAFIPGVTNGFFAGPSDMTPLGQGSGQLATLSGTMTQNSIPNTGSNTPLNLPTQNYVSQTAKSNSGTGTAPTPTPTQPSNNNNNSGVGLAVGTIQGNRRWTGVGWEDAGGQGGGQPADPYASLRNDIGSAWDSYLNSLNGTSSYLNDQQNAQRGIADTQYQAGQDTANNQKAQSLKDIANTTRNAFQAGNNYLGSMGAGDSSAANQYTFAINQQAGKQTGDLNNFVSGQMQQLQTQHDTSVNQIAQWFAQQQEALKQQMAQGGLQKSQDINNLSKGILDQAMQWTNQLKTNTQNQYNALVTWAANNSTNIGQLQSNIAAIPQAMGQLQLGAGSQGVGGGNQPLFGGTVTNTTDKTKNIFGQ
jgi:hypothetical protein